MITGHVSGDIRLSKRENMKSTSVGLVYSLVVIMAVLPYDSDAAIRVGNKSRNNAEVYQQLNEVRYTSSAEVQQPAELPINVKNTDLAEQIRSGDVSAGVSVDTLEQCSMIYPTGVFEWARPTLGLKAGSSPMCTSVVEMRALGAGPNGENLVLARANLAAGDSVKCNISAFPEAAWLPDAGNVIFPADKAPTMEDVVAVMNEEQKQNAAIKIVGGTILGGLLGNFTGANDVGNDGMLGTDKDKLKNTAIGAVSGAALMVGNTYGGKVAGDVILSTGVNAAAGGVIGNVVASGDSVLRIQNCTVNNMDTTCLWGYYNEETGLGDKQGFVNTKRLNTYKVCTKNGNNEFIDCEYKNLRGGLPDEYKEMNSQNQNKQNFKYYTLESARADNFQLSKNSKYCSNGTKMVQGECTSDDNDTYVMINDASIVTKRHPVMLVDIQDKAFGYKKSDWDNNKNGIRKSFYGKAIIGRNTKGEQENLVIRQDDKSLITSLTFGVDTEKHFEPMTLDAEDGGIIDLNNKARLKGTLAGAGVGGAMGAYTAYQGAQDDVTQRWLAETQAYKDSLNKIVCVTGTRFLSSYNDEVIIPAVTQQ